MWVMISLTQKKHSVYMATLNSGLVPMKVLPTGFIRAPNDKTKGLKFIENHTQAESYVSNTEMVLNYYLVLRLNTHVLHCLNSIT